MIHPTTLQTSLPWINWALQLEVAVSSQQTPGRVVMSNIITPEKSSLHTSTCSNEHLKVNTCLGELFHSVLSDWPTRENTFLFLLDFLFFFVGIYLKQTEVKVCQESVEQSGDITVEPLWPCWPAWMPSILELCVACNKKKKIKLFLTPAFMEIRQKKKLMVKIIQVGETMVDK